MVFARRLACSVSRNLCITCSFNQRFQTLRVYETIDVRLLPGDTANGTKDLRVTNPPGRFCVLESSVREKNMQEEREVVEGCPEIREVFICWGLLFVSQRPLPTG